MKTYEIIKEFAKYNIYYKDGDRLIGKEFHSLDGIGGTIRPGFKNLNNPDWENFEQTLVYTALFSKAIATANPNMFTVLNTSIQNGKNGKTSQNFFKNILENLGVNWTTEEKAELNGYLTDNNFTIQIS